MKQKIKDRSRGSSLGQISVSNHGINPRAFTSLELLVVIAVLAILAAILLPALASTKEKNIRIVCANNEKQLYTSLQIYCAEKGDKLPFLDGSGGRYPWDAPASFTTATMSYGCTKKTFYCPSTAPRFTDQVNWMATNSLWNYGVPNFNITGYSYAFGGGGSMLGQQYQNFTILSEVHTNGALIFVDSPPTRELIADVILSTGNSLPASASDNFTSIYGGFTQNGVGYPHLSAHLRTGGVPSGGNIAFKDGHVQWRKFDASHPFVSANNTKVRTGSNNPYFWW